MKHTRAHPFKAGQRGDRVLHHLLVEAKHGGARHDDRALATQLDTARSAGEGDVKNGMEMP